MDVKFIDSHLRRSVKVLFPAMPLRVHVENIGIKTQQMFHIIVEQIDSQNLIQIRITQVNDHSKMFISTIDNMEYEQIRTEQSLHVTFQGFVDHLIKILDSCKREELHLALITESNRQSLHIFEKSSFKNLTHLFLPMDVASTDTVLFHMNQTFQDLRAQIETCSSKMQQNQHELNTQHDIIAKLKGEIMSLNGRIMEQEHLIFGRNNEEINRLNQTIKNLYESKDTEEKRLKVIINSMQEKIDQLAKETFERTERMVQEAKRWEAVREENVKLRNQNAQIKNDFERLQTNVSAQQNRESKAEAALAELKRQMVEVHNKLKLAEQQRSELETELEAEKNICQTKKHALQLTTDELASASTMINNLNKDIMKFKSKLDLRTEIAMRQEKMLLEKDKQLQELSGIVAAVQQEHVRNRTINEEYALTVKRIKETTDIIEEKYRKKINDMISKISVSQNVDTSCMLPNQGKYLRQPNRIE